MWGVHTPGSHWRSWTRLHTHQGRLSGPAIGASGSATSRCAGVPEELVEGADKGCDRTCRWGPHLAAVDSAVDYALALAPSTPSAGRACKVAICGFCFGGALCQAVLDVWLFASRKRRRAFVNVGRNNGVRV